MTTTHRFFIWSAWIVGVSLSVGWLFWLAFGRFYKWCQRNDIRAEDLIKALDGE